MEKRQIANPTVRHFYPWPLVLVSCISAEGKPNIITIGASSVCCARPLVIGIAIGVRQYSYELMQATGDFGVNIPHVDQLEGADYCGCVSGRTTNKFEDLGWTPESATRITSPLIEECPVGLECKIAEVAHLGDHDWVMGEVVAASIDEAILTGDSIDPTRTDPVFSFYGEYWSIGEKLERWHFAR